MAQLNHCTISGRQRTNGMMKLHGPLLFSQLMQRIGIRGGGKLFLHLFDIHMIPLPPLHRIQTDIGGNAPNPGQKRTFHIKRMQPLIGTDKGLLAPIFRRLSVPGQPITYRKDRVLITAHDVAKCGGIALLCLEQQQAVGKVGHTGLSQHLRRSGDSIMNTGTSGKKLQGTFFSPSVYYSLDTHLLSLVLMDESKEIEQALQGNNRAWTMLITAHQEAVFRLAYLMVRDAEAADDLAQETFIRAYHALARFDTSRPLRPWLLSITVNLVRNQRRAWGRYLLAIQRWWQQTPPPVSLESLTHAQLEADALGQALQRLSTADREVLALRFFLELTAQETADVLGIPPGTVKSRQHRALERLRQVVAKEFPTLQEGRTHERTA